MQTKSIFASKTFSGLFILIIGFVARKLHFSPRDEDVASAVDVAMQAVGSLMVAWGRLSATHDLTLTGAPAQGGEKVSMWVLFATLATFAALSLSACSAVDSVSANGGYDPTTGGISGGATVHLRNPRGLAK